MNKIKLQSGTGVGSY